MAATQAQYAAAIAAGTAVVQKDIKADIPQIFQGQIPADKVQAFIVEMAHAMVNAALAVS